MGTTFYVELTYTNSADGAGVTRGPRKMELSKEEFKNRKILVVDDNKVEPEGSYFNLAEDGLLVEVAQNGMEAANMAAENDYDLLLMDIQMPELNGFEATKRIRANGLASRSRLPIIAMTASALSSEKNKCIEAGKE